MTAQPLRVLLVEDSPTDQKLLTHALRQTGRPIELERVEDAPAMKAALERSTWDVIISDWSMPKFSAVAALEMMKRMEIDLPFIIVSGTIGEEVAVEAMRAGAHDFVLKDKLTRLVPAVEREVRESEIRRERRQATKALLESEARYRRIVETTNEGIWLIDADAKTTFMNARMARILGCKAEDTVGRSPAEFLDDEGRRVLVEYLQRANTGAGDQVEVSYVRSDGTKVPCLLEANPVLDADGRYEGSLAMVMDISERVRAEAAQRASESRFRRLWDSGIILITVSDVAGRIVEVNNAGLRMLGYSRDELISGAIRWDDITPPESRAADETARAQLIANGVALPWEKVLVRKDGRHVPILAAAAILEGSEGIAIAIDLTDLKRTEQDLQERMHIAALTADIAMVLTHEDVLERILERCAESLVEHLGATFACVWTVDAHGSALVLHATAGAAQVPVDHNIPIGHLRVGRVAESKVPYITNDVHRDSEPGEPMLDGITAFVGQPLLVDDELVGVVALYSSKPLSEVTLNGLAAIADTLAVGVQRNKISRANVQLEAQLRQAQKMEAIGRLAGGIAHDFNNILSVIMACGEFILSDLKPDDPVREDATEIEKAAARAADLTRQLLMFSRQQVLEPRVLDLDKVLEKMDRMLRRILGEDVDVSIKRTNDLGRIRVDPGSVEQVIMNLVVNARDAMPTGGKLRIETASVVLDQVFLQAHPRASPGPHVVLSVSDTGSGMDQATLLRIFEPFFTTKPVGKGTGLGLSTVFGIVEQSQGFIRVESEPGTGTTFYVYFPQVDAALDSAGSSRPLATRRGTETVLLVEDEDQVRMVARGILKRHGYRVIEMRGPGEALLYCETNSQHIHLLLTDVVMPQMSGPELARRLVLMRPTLKVLCMSGYTDDSIVRHGVLEDQIAFLQKPFTSDTLTRKVREVLGGA